MPTRRPAWPPGRFPVLVLLVSTTAAALFAISGVGGAPRRVQDDDSAPARAIDQRAEDLLRSMSDAVGAATRIRFRAVSDEAVVDAGTGRVTHYLNEQTISIARPDRLHAEVGDVFARHETWFDGGTLTVYDSLLDGFTVIATPPEIDGMLEALHRDHGLVIPLSDLVIQDPFAALIDGITAGDYLGESLLGTERCHHLAFQQDAIDWQIWIAADEPAVPLKLVITYTSDPGHPQFSARFEDWNLSAELDPALFTPDVPETAGEVDLAELTGQGGAS